MLKTVSFVGGSCFITKLSEKTNKRMEATDGSHQLDNKKKIHFLQRFS